MSDTPGRSSRLARLRRRLGLDRNPLRRRVDRVEISVMAGLLAAFLVGAPFAAAVAGHWSEAAGLRAMRAQAGWRQVPAVLLESAPKDAGFVYQPSAIEWVRARWTTPGGAVHVGEVPVISGARAGTTVRVWIDAAGQEAGDLITRAQITGRAITTAAFGPIVLAVALLSIAALTRWLLERRRLAEWETAWTSVEPQWNHRR